MILQLQESNPTFVVISLHAVYSDTRMIFTQSDRAVNRNPSETTKGLCGRVPQ